MSLCHYKKKTLITFYSISMVNSFVKCKLSLEKKNHDEKKVNLLNPVKNFKL